MRLTSRIRRRARTACAPSLFLVICSGFLCLQAVAAGTTRYVSTSGNDTDNDCVDSANACATITHAVDQSNAGDTVEIAVGTYTEHGITVGKNLTVNGHNANDTVVRAAATAGTAIDRVFTISSGNTVTISGLTITNGAADNGGGIYNDHAVLTLSNCIVSGNSASSSGGGIVSVGSSGSATLTVNGCTISGNAAALGGGIDNIAWDSGSATLAVNNSTINGNSASSGAGMNNDGENNGTATLTVTNSTLSANSASSTGGGINNTVFFGAAPLTVQNSTLSGNSGGGISNDSNKGPATLTIGSTILNAGPSGPNITAYANVVTSEGYNLSSDDSSAFLNQSTDQNSTNPKLGGLAYYGGATASHILLAGSPAIDKGKNFSGATTDQRGPGFGRMVGSAAATGGDGTDIGAFERQTSDVDPTLIVTTTADTTANPSCSSANPCSLRDAITAANNNAGDDVIYFAVTGTITLNTNGALPGLSSNVKILGPAAKALTVKRDSSASAFGIFAITTGETVTLSGLTITGGSAGGSSGGGISNDHATLTVTDCTVSGNSAHDGGGINNYGELSGSATLTITNSTVSGNTASSTGAGIRNTGAHSGSATLTISNSTLSGNSASAHGGGVENNGDDSGSATLTITNSTLSGNSAATEGGGIENLHGVLSLNSSIVAKNTASNTAPDISATVASGDYNLIENTSGTGSMPGTHNITGVDPMLGPLQDNGGPSFTHALLFGSPALDAGNPNFDPNAFTPPLLYDQRGPGFPRVRDGRIDIGAFELQEKVSTSISTQASSDTTIGGSISDTATISSGGNPTGTVTFKLYGPDGGGCSTTPIFTSTKSIDSGGQATSDSYTPTTPGTYRWIASYSGDPSYSQADGLCNDPNESVTVSKATPSVTTQASTNTIVGGAISDSATLSGSYDASGTITFNVYGPNDTSNCGATPAFTRDVTVNGDGTYSSGTFLPGSPGTYRFVAIYNGDGNNNSVSTTCGDAHESVEINKANPTISTQASGSSTVGGTISDTATISGGVNPTGTVTFTLYGPDDTSCGGIIIFHTSVPLGSDRKATSASYSPDTPGTYVWRATYDGDSNNNSVSTGCNDANESVTVSNANATLTTQSSPDVELGGSISDTATLNTGGNPTGTISFSLYGPDDASCGGDVIFSSTVTVNGNGSYQSALFTPTSAGSYRWIASYSGDSGHTSAVTSCSDSAEVVHVTVVTRARNLSTRGFVGLNDNVLIGGFIISGDEDRQVVVRAIGPSTGIAGAIADPVLELHGPTSFTTLVNDNWQEAGNASQIPTALQPKDSRESALLVTLGPGTYTVVVRGKGNTTGIGLVEIYDTSTAATSAQLANLSTRGLVQTNDNVLIGGFIVNGNANANVVLRAIGPSLADRGVPGPLVDPVLDVRNKDGTRLGSNDNWQEDPNASTVDQAGLAPANQLESALYLNVIPGEYTAVVTGNGGTTGVGLVEIYHLQGMAAGHRQ